MATIAPSSRRTTSRRSVPTLLMLVVIVVMALACAYFGWVLLQAHQRMESGGALVHRAEPFSADRGASRSVLVIGDSVAYGVGVSSPEASFAGQIAQRLPDVDVVNKAVIGGTAPELADSIPRLVQGRHDAIFITVGGNDVARYGIDIEASAAAIEQLAIDAADHASDVYLFTPADFREVSAFPTPIRWFYSRRSRVLRDAARDVAAAHPTIHYIDLHDVDLDERGGREAADGFHPNDAGIRWMVDAALGDDRARPGSDS